MRDRRVIDELTAGCTVSDSDFDALLSPGSRRLSSLHWTPVDVARRAAALLADGRARRILDVGSGAGKFCVIGALTTPASFVGVESRDALVREARATCHALGIERVSFVRGDISEVDWREFDGFYLYNPFYENIDGSKEVREERFDALVHATRSRLEEARPGVRVVTFHGFGGDLPAAYVRESHEEWDNDFLDLWVKRAV